MKTSKRLPDAELIVMQAVWQAGKTVTSAEIQQVLQSYHWKPTSVLTFLARLTEKGFLSCAKQGKMNAYTACITEQDYQHGESIQFIQRLYHGSVKDLVASLADAGAMTQDDFAELRAFLDGQNGEG